MSPKKFVLALAGMSLISGVATADIITFKFTGTVTYGGALASVGDKITGLVSYETNTLPLNDLTGYAYYKFPAPFVISASVGDHQIIANNPSVTVTDNFGGNIEDSVTVSGGSVAVDNTTLYSNGSFGFQIASNAGNTQALTNTNLPVFFDLTAFDAGPTQNYGQLQMDGSSDGQLLQFSIDSIVNPQQPPQACHDHHSKVDKNKHKHGFDD
jgi:hypothetical protein